jgi:succinate dehydrogenase / fumarate reductase cytochrome b subunit
VHDNVKITLPGYAKYKGKGFHAFILHRISGLGTILFLTLHITTTATVFFAPQWYDVLVEIFRNPIIMIAEIILAFFVIYHGVNGLRIAYVDLIRIDLWKKKPTSKLMSAVFIVTFLLWLPAAGILGYNLLKYGFNLFGS